MKRGKIERAMWDAQAFVKRAKIVIADDNMKYVEIGCGNKESGALRRQSMELTRALAEMRKP